ncbi:hypothetical protein MJO28_016585 [Puccinia striiformis f. sp. tritici]|uniref:Uncharacterized protein n=1 Tax=Puccinia striiformis f. sp. tritici TaxID=168172 RepID=A0ACC0DPR0_9BASI|nr:hypothetical protein Pst134EA_030326 [Puccinia striiformis f. sp. tritici]KAH9446406.1 hypothetical protein Pst134EA_030326 [Puccinia striiformis f. sp. tritici]KAI7935714.1 hypothetical protein MJO28_016585 [Puccinia striiformis f. sp. tritici]KAI9599912.1 hypothetical protein KEM48_000020 [Puccinia striiformis f. sp. tritici PST-130]
MLHHPPSKSYPSQPHQTYFRAASLASDHSRDHDYMRPSTIGSSVLSCGTPVNLGYAPTSYPQPSSYSYMRPTQPFVGPGLSMNNLPPYNYFASTQPLPGPILSTNIPQQWPSYENVVPDSNRGHGSLRNPIADQNQRPDSVWAKSRNVPWSADYPSIEAAVPSCEFKVPMVPFSRSHVMAPRPASKITQPPTTDLGKFKPHSDLNYPPMIPRCTSTDAIRAHNPTSWSVDLRSTQPIARTGSSQILPGQQPSYSDGNWGRGSVGLPANRVNQRSTNASQTLRRTTSSGQAALRPAPYTQAHIIPSTRSETARRPYPRTPREHDELRQPSCSRNLQANIKRRETSRISSSSNVNHKFPVLSSACNISPELSIESLDDPIIDQMYDIYMTGIIPAIEAIQLDELGGRVNPNNFYDLTEAEDAPILGLRLSEDSNELKRKASTSSPDEVQLVDHTGASLQVEEEALSGPMKRKKTEVSSGTVRFLKRNCFDQLEREDI